MPQYIHVFAQYKSRKQQPLDPIVEKAHVRGIDPSNFNVESALVSLNVVSKTQTFRYNVMVRSTLGLLACIYWRVIDARRAYLFRRGLKGSFSESRVLFMNVWATMTPVECACGLALRNYSHPLLQ